MQSSTQNPWSSHGLHPQVYPKLPRFASDFWIFVCLKNEWNHNHAQCKKNEKKDGIVSWVLHLQNQFGHRKRGVCFSSFVWKKNSAGCWHVSFWEGPLEIHHIFFPEGCLFGSNKKSTKNKWGNKCKWFLHLWIKLDKEMTPSRNSMIFFQILVASRGGIAIRCIS